MNHYGILDSYNEGSKYYISHYICLWEVTEEEIIGHYDWQELFKNTNWYEEVIMPAFRKSEGEKKSDLDLMPASAFDMSMIEKILSSKSLANVVMYETNHESRVRFPYPLDRVFRVLRRILRAFLFGQRQWHRLR
jgi:hypothetical protein